MRTTTPKRPEGIGEEATAVVRAPVVPSKMMAAVLYGSEDLRLEKIDVPPLAADEVLLRVRLALTDGTDLKVWQRGYHAKMIQPPAVFGHEVVGEVAAVGKRVDSRWRLGLRVVAANSAPCLRCFHCRRGQENLCEDLLFNNGAIRERTTPLDDPALQRVFRWYDATRHPRFGRAFDRRPRGVRQITDVQVEIIDGRGRRTLLEDRWIFWP